MPLSAEKKSRSNTSATGANNVSGTTADTANYQNSKKQAGEPKGTSIEEFAALAEING